jgi:hypothetical protein
MKPVGVITLTDILKRVCAAAEEQCGDADDAAESAGLATPSLSVRIMTTCTHYMSVLHD